MTSCRRLWYRPRVPPTRTPLKRSRQSAESRRRRAEGGKQMPFILTPDSWLLNPGLAPDTWNLLFPTYDIPPTVFTIHNSDSNPLRALWGGVFHRSTIVAYYISSLVSRAEAQESGFGIQERLGVVLVVLFVTPDR
jgi:hypothetical protein